MLLIINKRINHNSLQKVVNNTQQHNKQRLNKLNLKNLITHSNPNQNSLSNHQLKNKLPIKHHNQPNLSLRLLNNQFLNHLPQLHSQPSQKLYLTTRYLSNLLTSPSMISLKMEVLALINSFSFLNLRIVMLLNNRLNRFSPAMETTSK